jgi:hypothetical protein
MNDLKQVQPLVDAQGRLLHLVGLDARGNVYYGRLTPAGHDKYKLDGLRWRNRTSSRPTVAPPHLARRTRPTPAQRSRPPPSGCHPSVIRRARPLILPETETCPRLGTRREHVHDGDLGLIRNGLQ